jgi:O-antigen ligase
MLNKFNKLLIILLITFAGADRINFGVNLTDSFILTPFLVLSVIYLLITILFFIRKIKLNWLIDNKFFFLSFALFLWSVIMSAVFSPEIIMSSKRIVLLFIIIIIFIIILSEYGVPQINSILISSSIYGSILYFIFNVLMLSNWLGVLEIEILQINFIPDTIAYYIPRLGGFSSDVNRGGFVLSFYTYILWVNRKKISFSGILLCLNLAMLFLTLSRSTYLLLFILFLSYALLFQRHLFNIEFMSYLLIPLLVLIVVLIQMDNIGIIEIGPAIEERFSITSGKSASASIHFDLIAKGTKLILSDMKYFFVGIGHGASYLLTDGYYWSGSKYGNFHSQYLAIFIENGVFAFFSFLFFTLIYPIYLGKKNIYLPLLIALIFFNIFYQLTNEPTYWLVILLFYKFQNDVSR